MKIAIVGSGISGLTAASILHRRYEITVYEANDYIGGHTNTVVLNERGRTLPIDTGFIVFNKRNYPNLCRLFDALGVECRDSDMSFSVHCERSGLEYNGASLRKLFVQPVNLVRPSFRVMLSDILRFNREAPHELTNGLTDSMTVARYLATKGYGPGFRDHYLLPLGASLWSCHAERFREFSMRFVIEFLYNLCMLQVNERPVWKTVVGGSHQYVRRLTKEFRDRVRLNTPVRSVARRGQHVDVRLRDNSVERFDEVILAAHADQSLQLMESLYDDDTRFLSFPINTTRPFCTPIQLFCPTEGQRGRVGTTASLARGHRGWR